MPSTKQTLSEKIGVGKVLTKKVRITNAQIKAMRATPITLITGVPNKVIVFRGAELELIYGSNVFTESSDNMAIKFTDGSGAAVSDTIEATNFIDAAANTVTSAVPVKDAIAALSAAVGKALVLHNTGDGEYAGNAGADNKMTVVVSYTLADLTS